MPPISAVSGIVITTCFGDHPPPHFHARDGEHVAEIAIDALELIDGWLPPVAWPNGFDLDPDAPHGRRSERAPPAATHQPA